MFERVRYSHMQDVAAGFAWRDVRLLDYWLSYEWHRHSVYGDPGMCLCLLFSHIQPVTGSQCSVVLYGRGAERHLGWAGTRRFCLRLGLPRVQGTGRLVLTKRLRARSIEKSFRLGHYRQKLSH